MLVLDTCVLIDGIELVDEPSSISIMSLVEMQSGLAASGSPVERARRQQQHDRVVRHYRPIPVDGAIVSYYGRVDAAVRASGRQPRSRTVDLIIAATAASRGWAVLTDNIDDFAGLEGIVEVRRPSRE